MKLLLFTLTIFSLNFIFTNNIHAIVVIVPAILIPIVNLIVWIISVISVPIAGLLFAYSRVKKVSYKKILLILFAILFLVSLVAFVILRMANPDRPIY